MQRFRGGLVYRAHRLVYHSTLGLRVITKKKRRFHELEFRVEGSEFCVSCFVVRVPGSGFCVLGFGVSCFVFRGSIQIETLIMYRLSSSKITTRNDLY